eukprot:Nk52_evm22s212 gene=Nk52_evmTU22s212
MLKSASLLKSSTRAGATLIKNKSVFNQSFLSSSRMISTAIISTSKNSSFFPFQHHQQTKIPSQASSSSPFQNHFQARNYAAADLPADVRKGIEDKINSADVVVFMKGVPDQPQCGFSKGVIDVFDYYGIEDFKAFNVLEDQELRENIKVFSDWPTIPQVYCKKEFVGGYDLLIELHQNDEMDDVFGFAMKEEEEGEVHDDSKQQKNKD